MAFLLLYIGEGKQFDVEGIKRGLLGSPRVQSQPTEDRCAFNCVYNTASDVAPIRVKDDAETIVVEGMGEAAFCAALEIQTLCRQPVHAIDESYTFDLVLANFSGPDQLERAIRKASDRRTGGSETP
jgi:hypothetical protein